MNGIENIVARIDADTQAKVADILAQAKAQADDIAANYQGRVNTLLSAERAKAEAQAAQTAQRAQAAGALEGRKWTLAAKQQLLAGTFALALDKLRALPQPEYIDLLSRLLLGVAQGGEEVVFNQADRAQVGKAVVTAANDQLANGNLTLSSETRDIIGGFILKSGPVEINCALETLVEQEKEAMSADLAARLFPAQ